MSAGRSASYSFDALGRMLTEQRTTAGATKTIAYKYNLDNSLASLTYPDGLVVSYTYDGAGRVTGASDSKGVVYVQSPTYLPTGAMQEFTSPNFSNFKFHTDYSSRLQPTEIWVGSGSGTSALLDRQYQYNPPGLSLVDNGNVYTIKNMKDDSRTQSFTYDVLNRLVSAQDKSHWANTYVYDAWGNLLQKIPGNPAGETLSKTADGSNRRSGVAYDTAGNITNDGINGYSYDPENRLIASAGFTYLYDGDGDRVQRSNGTLTTTYWYSAAGMLAESDGSGNFTDYIFFGGRRLARNVSGDIKYYITDHLGSTAIFADKSSTVLDDNDFYPWGGVVSNVGQTTSNNTIKFTGKIEDAETQLYYFGARYYSFVLGGWTRPDETLADQHPESPQTWNLYQYANNNPIVKIDPNGAEAIMSIVAGAQQQLAELKPGDQFTVVFLGVNSGMPNYMKTLTSVSIPDWSGMFGLGNLDTGPNGNTTVLPNNNGWFKGLLENPNQDEIDTFNKIRELPTYQNLERQGRVDAICHSNGVNACAQVSAEPGVHFGAIVLIAPGTGSHKKMDTIAGSSDGFTIVSYLDCSDNVLCAGGIPWFPGAESWSRQFPGKVVGIETPCHGAQCYISAINPVTPRWSPAVSQRLADEAAYGHTRLMIGQANCMGSWESFTANIGFQSGLNDPCLW